MGNEDLAHVYCGVLLAKEVICRALKGAQRVRLRLQ